MISGSAAAGAGGQKPILRLENISVAIGGCPILTGIDADFHGSRVNAVIGPNGSGKSTLLRAILGAVSRSSGRVLLGGREAERFGRREMARTIALVPQDTHLDFSFRVEELVLMGRYPHLRPLERERRLDREIAEEALRRLDLLPLRRRDVTTLSGGERQRVFIARALATEARLLLLDEPISHLDIGHRLDIFKLLSDLARSGYTIVVVLHDLDFAFRHADRILVLDRGRKASEGEPQEVLESGILEQVFGVRLAKLPSENGPHFTWKRVEK